jgi:hypothetical protein
VNIITSSVRQFNKKHLKTLRGKNMSKMNPQEVLKAKTLFSKLQNLTFSTLVYFKEEDRGHLDLESQEIIFKLKNNIQELSDLSSRVEFMMGELSQIMKKGI